MSTFGVFLPSVRVQDAADFSLVYVFRTVNDIGGVGGLYVVQVNFYKAGVEGLIENVTLFCHKKSKYT